MQPPTDTALPTPRGDEDALYRAHHAELRRTVARAVNAPRELIEDACQTAWTMLLRNQPDRYAIVGWLRVVAIHEAYRLSATERRDARLERLASESGDWCDVVPTAARSTTRSKPSKRSAPWPICPLANART